jgi:hypothetical protein
VRYVDEACCVSVGVMVNDRDPEELTDELNSRESEGVDELEDERDNVGVCDLDSDISSVCESRVSVELAVWESLP